MYACLKDQPDAASTDRFLQVLNMHEQTSVDAVLASLKGDGLALASANTSDGRATDSARAIINGLASNGFLTFKSARDTPALVLAPASSDFDCVDDVDLRPKTWKISRFFYLHQHDGEIVLRNPKALYFLTKKRWFSV